MEDARYECVLVFCRAFLPGDVSVQGESLLRPEACAALHEAVVLDSVEVIAGCGMPMTIGYVREQCPFSEQRAVIGAFGEKVEVAAGNHVAVAFRALAGDYLSARLAVADELLALGYTGVILVDGESPYTMADDVLEARKATKLSLKSYIV